MVEEQTAVGLWVALGILAIVVAALVGFWVGRVTSDERKLIREGLYDPDINDATARKLLATSFGHKETAKHELEHSGEIDGERTLGDEEIAAIREALNS